LKNWPVFKSYFRIRYRPQKYAWSRSLYRLDALPVTQQCQNT